MNKIGQASKQQDAELNTGSLNSEHKVQTTMLVSSSCRQVYKHYHVSPGLFVMQSVIRTILRVFRLSTLGGPEAGRL